MVQWNGLGFFKETDERICVFAKALPEGGASEDWISLGETKFQ